MKTFFVAAALAMLGTIGAHAADVAPRTFTKAPRAATLYNWTGFYIGGNVGYGRTDANFDSSFVNTVAFSPITTAFLNGANDGRAAKDGFTGGAQIGYNWQFSPNWVLGVEADINSLSQKATRATNFTTGGGTVVSNFTNQIESEWIATVRGRVGYAFDRSMIYATGGLAVLESKYNQTFITGIPSSTVTSSGQTTAGWTVGGGWEYAFANNWSLKAEYLYARFENLNAAPGAVLVGFTDTLIGKADLDVQMARAGVNYKFGGPVVAKY